MDAAPDAEAKKDKKCLMLAGFFDDRSLRFFCFCLGTLVMQVLHKALKGNLSLNFLALRQDVVGTL
jgi:hypothetical protein